MSKGNNNKKKLTSRQRQARTYQIAFIFITVIVLLSMLLSQLR
jgi:hypothetical protein